MADSKDIKKTGPQSWRDIQKQNALDLQQASISPFIKLKPQNPYKSSTDFVYEGTESSPIQLGGTNDYWGRSQYDNTSANEEEYSAEQLGDSRYNNQPWYDTLANGVGKMFGTAATTFVSSVVGLPYGLFEAANQGRWSAIWDNDVTKGLADIDEWLEENMTNYKSQKQQNAPWYDSSNLFSMNFIADDIIKNAGFTLGAAASMAVGAGSMGLMSRSLGFVNEVSKGTKMANNVLSALFSATGEGMIEARQGVEERNKLEMQKLDDSFVPERNALEEEYNQIEEEYAATKDQTLVRGADGRLYDPAYQRREERLRDLRARTLDMQNRYDAGKQQIEESGRLMGNRILAANQALLTAGNLIQFSKGLTKSFDSARHAAEVSAKNTKPLFAGTRRVSSNIKDGYALTGSKGLGRTVAATKGLITEGSEEMNQQFIQSASGAAYNEADVNDYWRARQDPDAYRETTKGLYTLGNILDKGFQESWGDIDQWEQFLIGGLTGLAGTYMPTKIFNQDKSKAWYNPSRYGEWSGGAINEVNDYNIEYNQYKENIDDLNSILASEGFYDRARNMVAHTYHENEKDAAIEADDKKAYKDADDKQNIHDIQAFLRAGKLDDLRAIYNEMGANLSDDDINSIIKSTTQEVSAEKDKQDFDAQANVAIAQKQKDIDRLYKEIGGLQEGLATIPEDDVYGNRDYVSQQIQNRQQRINAAEQEIQALELQKENYIGKKRYVGPYVDEDGNIVKSKENIQEITRHNAEELNRKLDRYLNSIDVVNKMSGGNLTKAQEDNLAYLHNMYASKTDRFNKIMKDIRSQLPKKFLLKTNKTPEELAKSTNSTDLAFSVSDNTPKGYVEVDTSLINDETFAVFFADNVIWGQNIQPTISNEEIAEELKEREEDKKYTPEEQEKRRKEREQRLAEKAAKRNKESEESRKEQQDKNIGLIRQAFVENAMQRDNKTLYEALNSDELDKLFSDINDALTLKNEAAEFYDTFARYMGNPSLVDKDREKEAKKAEKDKTKKDTDNASLDEMMGMEDALLGSIAKEGKEGKNKSGGKALKALGMKNGKKVLSKELDKALKNGSIDAETAEDAMKLFDAQMALMAQEEDSDAITSMDDVTAKMLDTDTDIMNEPTVLMTEMELNDESTDETAYESRLNKAKDALNEVADSIAKQLREIEDSIDAGTLGRNLDDVSEDEKRDEAMLQSADETKEDAAPEEPAKPKRGKESPVTKAVNNKTKSKKEVKAQRIVSYGEDDVLISDKTDGEEGNAIPQSEKVSSNWHPWMSSTSEVGLRTNEPYQPRPNESDAEFKKQRYDAIRKKLVELGAYTARKAGRVTENMKVGFKVFQSVNDEAGDFVIFITDENGNVIGDVPSNDPRLDTSKRDVSMEDFYNKIQEEWDNASDAEKEAGMQSKYFSEVEHVLVGKVRYQDGRHTVKELMEGSEVKPLFAIKTNAGMVSKDVEGYLLPLTGNVGQPYVLIQTPMVHTGEGRFKYYCVPISTKTIGELGNDSLYIKTLKNVLYNIKTGKLSDAAAHSLLEALVAVGSVHVNLDEGSNTKKNLGIRVTTFDRMSGVEQGVPYTIYEGKREDIDIDAVVQALSGFRVNVSATYINGGNTGTGRTDNALTIGGNRVDYNAMIAEVAETNAAEPRTVNDWFTIKPLINDVHGDLKMVESQTTMPDWGTMTSDEKQTITVSVGGNKLQWEIDPKTLTITDEKGNEIITSKGNRDRAHSKAIKDEAKKQKAIFFGLRNLKSMEYPYACVIDGVTHIYDPTKGVLRTYAAWEAAPKYNWRNSKELKEAKDRGDLTEDEKYYIIQDYLDYVYSENLLSSTDKTIAKDNEAPVKDHTDEVRKTIAAMEEETSHYHLVRWDEDQNKYVEDENGNYYQDDRDGSVSARVSEAIDADEDIIKANEKAGFKGTSPAFVPSTAAGNAVDTFVRNFFMEVADQFETLDLSTTSGIEAAKKIAKEANQRIGNPNINEEDAINLMIELAKLKKTMPGFEINATGIKVHGTVSFDNKNAVNVTGTIDLLAYNPKTGQYAIIDMKSHVAPLFNSEGKINVDESTQRGKTNSAKIKHWEAQQTLYKNFLESKYGIKISGIRIMPFSVSYNTKFSETSYTVEHGVLKDKGITVDIHPKYDGKLIALSPKAAFNYRVASIPEHIKRLLPESKKPVTSQPKDEKKPLKLLLKIAFYSVPDGRSMKEFLKPEYKDNADVLALVELMENPEDAESVMMTMASQKLLLGAIDDDALNRAIVEDKAREQNIILDTPENTEEDTATIDNLSSDAKDIYDDLPEELQRKIASSSTLINRLSELADSGMDVSDIQDKLETIADKSIKHRKAVPMPYKKLDLKKELGWLKKNLPQLSNKRHLQIVEGLIRCSDGTDDFGQLIDNVITIGNASAEGTVYHEAFHAIVQLLLTDEEIDALFNAARERYGNMPEVALEERLAEDFSDYTRGLEYEGNIIKRFFRELWNAVKALFNNTPYIENLFRDINIGVYTGREFTDNRRNAFSAITKDSREWARSYECLTQEERDRINDAEVNKDSYNKLSKQEQEYMLHCVI